MLSQILFFAMSQRDLYCCFIQRLDFIAFGLHTIEAKIPEKKRFRKKNFI